MKKNNNETIGERIKAIRGEMKQKDFAELLGIGRTTLIRYEKNERTPDAEFLIKLNVLYKIQPLWLLIGQGQDVAGEKLSPREHDLIRHYRQCTEQEQQAFDHLLAASAKKVMQAE